MSTRHRRGGRRDPHFEREARRYAHPIPSREYVLEVLERHGRPMSLQALARALELDGEHERDAFAKRLGAMERDGQVMRNRRGDYGLISKMDLVRGRVSAHRDGFGFLVPDEGGEDLFLSPREMRGLMHGDRAVARIIDVDRQGRRQGALVEVLERNTHKLVGRYYRDRGVAVVRPENKRQQHDLLIPPDAAGGARHGQMVVAEIVEQPSKRSQPVGRVAEVLGDHMAPGMEIDVAIRAHDLPESWPEAVLEESAALPDEVAGTAARDRVDLRDRALVTIDGADARDFDDAVYCERTRSGWRLTVAIADVAAYVSPGSALD
ncbi:MAG: RNB domain-containing ribonuclease, partial [Gammaproteobacteria bacterium]|nr:RNB domain-containing ribonuclease [Gammaproteobacteria bacterium]